MLADGFVPGTRRLAALQQVGPLFSSTSSSASTSAAPFAQGTKLLEGLFGGESGKRLGELQALVKEVIAIVAETGVRPGLERGLQVGQALRTLSSEFLRDQSKFLDSATGSISAPKVLRRLFEELGSTYIKLGQFVASSPTLFPADYVLEFQACLDKSPTIPFSEVRSIIQSELGRPLSVAYDFVDPVPLASASIAQVHRARLKNGTEVVIKVQKPGAEVSLKADLGVLLVASKLLELINPSLSRLSLANIVGDIRASMLEELDFRLEAANLLNFRSFLEREGLSDVAVAPFPYVKDLSTKKVLTMDFLKGVPLVDLEGIRRFSSNPEQTLVAALRTWAASVVQNEIFHADVHGGNLLVLEDGRVGFIDFGIVGRISEKVWSSVGRLVQSFVVEDFRGMAAALVDMGVAEQTVDVDKFGRELQVVVERIAALQPEIRVTTAVTGGVGGGGTAASVVGTSVDVAFDERETTQLVLEIVAVAENNGLKLPREFGILLKQSLYFDRYQKLLAPGLDPLRDPRVRDSSAAFFTGGVGGSEGGRGRGRVIDAEIVG